MCEAAGIPLSTFYSRLQRGWTDEEAIQTPLHKVPERLTLTP
jgi:hypothetical protein